MHERSGCDCCQTEVGCDKDSEARCRCGSNIHDQERYRVELRCYEKAVKDPTFPNIQVQN